MEFKFPNPDPSNYISHEKQPYNDAYKRHLESNKIVSIGETTKQALATKEIRQPQVNITDLRVLINSCDYRGPIVSEGCQCTRLCWMGKGYNPDGLPYGKVKDYDCCKCVTEP